MRAMSWVLAGAVTLALQGVAWGLPIYAASFVTESLWRVDLEPVPPGAVEVGAFGANFTEGGLSFSSEGLLYGVFAGSIDALYEIDITTGEATQVGALGYDDISAIAFDPEDVLFGIDSVTDRLITVDPTTGAGAPFGDGDMGIVIGPVAGMTFGPDGTLYMVDNENASLYAFYDIASGDDTATLVGELGINKPTGLTFVLEDGGLALFVVDEADEPGVASELYRVEITRDGVALEWVELDPSLPDGVGGLAGIIPEPATFVLLVCGGLAIRGKRRYKRR